MARGVVAAALTLSAAVHLDLADSFDGQGEQISVGGLFRLQALAALLVALWLLLRRRDRLPVMAAAAAVAVGVLAQVSRGRRARVQ